MGDQIMKQLSKGTTAYVHIKEDKDNSQTEEDSIIFIVVFILTY